MSDYESKLTWFLVLLVLFLAVVSFQSTELSKKARAALESEFSQRALDTSMFVAEKLDPAAVEAEMVKNRATPYVASPLFLHDLEVRYGLAGLSVLDLDGMPVLGTEAREKPPVSETVRLHGNDRTRVLAGEAVVSDDYREPLDRRTLRDVYRIVVSADGRGRPVGILRVSFEVHPIAALGRLSTTLLVYQVMGFAVVLVLLLVFVRWFMTPYRALMSTARAAGMADDPRAAGDETGFVVSAFRETIARLRDREEELRRLHLREKERADEQARLATHITRSMASGVVVLTRDGGLDFMNRAAEEILRVERGEAGREPAAIFGNAPDLLRLVLDSLRTGETHPRCEVELLAANGTRRALGASTFPIIDDDGKIAGALALCTDLTDIKNLQERVRLRENLASLGEMSAGIAHEFRNSLAAILGFANLLEKKLASDPSLRDEVRTIKSEAEGLNRVVSEFLRFARPLTPARQLLDLRDLVADCVRELRSQPAFASVVFDLQELLPVHLQADELLLRQAFGNLLRNGAEAAMAARADPPRVTVRGFRDQGEGTIHISVSDNGGGVPESERERIFLPFFTTKEAGTGLGLAITQKVIVAHDGEIRLLCKLGEGACFLVVLPEAKAIGAASGTMESSKAAPA